MQLKEILEFTDKVDAYFKKKNPDIDQEKRVLYSAMKLTEEVGELNEQLFYHYGHGREEKRTRYSPEHLEHEIADVVLAALMIAEKLTIDAEKALAEKMKIVKERFGIE